MIASNYRLEVRQSRARIAVSRALHAIFNETDPTDRKCELSSHWWWRSL